jgi:hypothetical protein
MTNAQDPTPGTTRDPRAHREDMTRLVREEAARRRTSEEASHAGERKSRIPYRLLAILVLATVTVIAATRSVSEVMVFLKHPGETPVRGMSLVEVDRLVPSVSLGVDGKTLVVNVGAGWESLDHEERSRRFTSLCSVLANRFYHGARLVAPSGRVVGNWAEGLIRVE